MPEVRLVDGRLEAVLDLPEEHIEEVRIAFNNSSGESAYRTFRAVDNTSETPFNVDGEDNIQCI